MTYFESQTTTQSVDFRPRYNSYKAILWVQNEMTKEISEFDRDITVKSIEFELETKESETFRLIIREDFDENTRYVYEKLAEYRNNMLQYRIDRFVNRLLARWESDNFTIESPQCLNLIDINKTILINCETPSENAVNNIIWQGKAKTLK